jgi:hypothetical protein
LNRSLRIETGAENLGIERLFEAIAHVRRMVIFNIHVEPPDVGKQEIEDRMARKGSRNEQSS